MKRARTAMAKSSIRGLKEQNFMLGQNMRFVHYNLKHMSIESSLFSGKVPSLIGFQFMLHFQCSFCGKTNFYCLAKLQVFFLRVSKMMLGQTFWSEGSAICMLT